LLQKVKDNAGYTLAHWAVMHKQIEIIKALLRDYPACFSAVDDGGANPAHWAYWYGDQNILGLLSQRQPQLMRMPDRLGRFPPQWKEKVEMNSQDSWISLDKVLRRSTKVPASQAGTFKVDGSPSAKRMRIKEIGNACP
jgi:hypothetical protein